MKFLDLLDRFANLLVTVVRWVCIVLAAALFIIVVAAVVARYGFGGWKGAILVGLVVLGLFRVLAWFERRAMERPDPAEQSTSTLVRNRQ